MGLPAKLVRAQLHIMKPIAANLSLEATRKGQDKLGEIMEAIHRRDVFEREHDFGAFQGAWLMPKDERRQGVILYLHGGGYTCGSLEYAKGFAATLADECGVRVFCAAYRLAPEHRYPAALDDALEAYRYLLKKGYPARQILLCGESAGGGLIYALCLRLRAEKLPLPCGLIAISPWSDLTQSGESYVTNRDVDPSMTKELLDFYAKCYADDPAIPYCSPLFGDLRGFPPSLLFVGGDEVMLDDTRRLHAALQKAGCDSQMVIAPERWHAYVLYYLSENMSDFDTINTFLTRVLSPAKKLRWMRLDNAAKIYPAAKRRGWTNYFRLSATLNEPVDTKILAAALDVTVRRFPSIAVRLRRGAFWYYLEQIPKAPPIEEDKSYPLVHVPFDDVRKCAFRVLVYHERIAVEFFHAVTDGTGGMIFLKTLVAEYLCQRYGISIPAEHGVLGRLEDPSEEEMEDSFLRYAGNVHASRKESTAYQLSGTLEPDGFLNLTTLMVPVDAVRKCAKEHHVSVTELLARGDDEGHLRASGGADAAPAAPQAGEGAAAGQSAADVPQPDAAELRLLCHAGDRSAARRLHVRRDLPRSSLPDGAGERPADDGREDRDQRRKRAFARAAGNAAVHQECGDACGVRHGGRDQILPVPVQPRARGAAGGDGPVCRADGLYHRRPGEGAL